MKSDLAVPAYGAAAALLLILVWEWLPATETFVPIPAQTVHIHGRVNETDSVAHDTQAWANAIIRRPLFNVGRKPPKISASHSPVAITGLPRLSGIMITRAGRRAIFMPEGGKALTLAEGATLDDYTIRRILADQVVLNGAKGDMVLRPAYDSARGNGNGMTINNAEMPAQPGPPGGGFPLPPFGPGFRPPGMPMPQPPPQPNSDDDDNSDAPSPPQVQPQPFPGFRGPFIPRGRTQ